MNTVVSSQRESDAFFIVKAFAIISVIYAHLSFSTPALQKICGSIGMIGVPVFLMISGYYFSNQNATQFWKKKLKTIVVPWILYAIITYGIHCIADTMPFKFRELIAWTLGYQTWLYFVPVLLCCFLVGRMYYLLPDRINTIYAVSIFALSIVSKYLTHIGFLKLTSFITPYQNVFNFVCYFLFGIYLRKKRKRFPELNRKSVVGLCTVSVLLLAARMGGVLHFPIAKVLLAMLENISLFFTLFYCSLYFKKNALLIYAGKHSFVLYFVHMQLGVSIYKLLLSRVDFVSFLVKDIISLSAPFIIVCIWLGLIRTFEYITKKYHVNKFNWIFGLSGKS